MEIKKDQEEHIINFGALSYDAKKIANILNIEVDDIIEEIYNKDSDFYKLYQKGNDMFDYAIDMKLFEMAKSGDIKALEKLEVRKLDRNDY